MFRRVQRHSLSFFANPSLLPSWHQQCILLSHTSTTHVWRVINPLQCGAVDAKMRGIVPLNTFRTCVSVQPPWFCLGLILLRIGPVIVRNVAQSHPRDLTRFLRRRLFKLSCVSFLQCLFPHGSVYLTTVVSTSVATTSLTSTMNTRETFPHTTLHQPYHTPQNTAVSPYIQGRSPLRGLQLTACILP